jgi:hypothetical protein
MPSQNRQIPRIDPSVFRNGPIINNRFEGYRTVRFTVAIGRENQVFNIVNGEPTLQPGDLFEIETFNQIYIVMITEMAYHGHTDAWLDITGIVLHIRPIGNLFPDLASGEVVQRESPRESPMTTTINEERTLRGLPPIEREFIYNEDDIWNEDEWNKTHDKETKKELLDSIKIEKSGFYDRLHKRKLRRRTKVK